MEFKKITGLFQSLTIPEWKGEHIVMDIITGLHRSTISNHTIGFIMDKLSKSAHFTPFRVR